MLIRGLSVASGDQMYCRCCYLRNIACAILFFAHHSANAGNGLNLIGFGIESNFLAGADIAVSRDTSALNTNPAGLTQIDSTELDSHFAIGYSGEFRHEDSLGNNRSVEGKFIPLGDFGFAHTFSGTGITAGFGMFGQGGSGYRYSNLNTAFGTRDELSALFRIGKLTPGIAYRASDRLSLGIALPIVVGDLRQKLFPETSVFNSANPGQSFFGSELKDARGAALGVRLGAQYRISDAITFGVTYSSKTRLPLKDGHVRLNMTATGLGKVNYRNAQVDGLALPQEIGFGVSVRPDDPWLISVKVAWLNWSDALNSTTLTATDPDNPAAPTRLENKGTLNWRDQYVFALGAEYKFNDRTSILGGYNYGKNPIPNETTNPLLAAFAEQHITLGVLHKFGASWVLAAGLEYDFRKTVTYNNPELPFGAGARETGELAALHVGLTRRW